MNLHSHSAALTDDIVARDNHAECSCGWVGENVNTPTGPRQSRQQLEHMAMADWAAHVHVAEGLATGDDDG
jgi:hypothetical protein